MLAEEKAQSAQARNRIVHVTSLSATKLADGLINPKLVLSWLLNALGAPVWMVGWLVPVREALAMAPQLLIAPRVRAAVQRKGFWAFGSIGQGLAALTIAAAAFWLEGAVAGAVILAALALLSLCRAVCSTSYKDVLGKTVPKSSRGKTTGLAASLAALVVFAFGAALATGILPKTVLTISLAVAFAGCLWVISGLLFLRLDEPDSETETGDEFGFADMLRQLRDSAQLKRLIAARALLVPTALAPPFFIALSGQGGAGDLGRFILATALASIIGGYLWGWLCDRSSRKSLMIGGTLAACAIAFAALMGENNPANGIAATLFVASLGYEGVRAGRKIHLTDMAAENDRAVYTALSNTIVGLVLMLGGALGALAQVYGPEAALAASAILCLAGVAVAFGLDEVQG